MACVTADYYTNTFHGHAIPADAFERIEADAEEMINGIVQLPVTEEDGATDQFKRAVCYQIETLYAAGGMDGINNRGTEGIVTSVSNDGYSESRKVDPNAVTFGGMPVSAMTLNLLQGMGYLKRWVYSGGYPE
ncbi:MAG: hypothetical protein PHY64_03855 [Eubacteriales bacterium]|nr:hypothetical protein [Eubacteriales bacterium]